MVQTSVIGCGNMGSALITGLWRAGNHTIVACDLDPDALARVEDYVERTTSDVSEATDADVVIVAVKPDIVDAVLDELDLSPDQTLLSIAAGVSTDYVEARTDANVVRIMPNLAAETGDMAAAVTGDEIPDEVRELLGDVGEFAEVDERQMDIATAVNGSGPAFVFYLIQAMAEAGIEGGLESDDAERLAAQTFKGAAETVLRSDRSTEELIDAVCSPNGTTIEGMEVLWDSDADAAVAAAVRAAEERAAELTAEFGNENDA
ncbi:pyrroline-5-carboxylate reductase [Haloterrigena turkmenica DSM 5511]|uniref:Pyrroline-5-carboxylate reductase n=1 Tax=Haloterrigena turkmenica (strain ATCC 51198 / DSM 5511 / JCM 9101 / NCIMB 13204 / VKM B-1734 / 4k) TaxID=543526 RepID=D2RTY6_HALTV|nr:pyrroline-5-carboxylate reductase [Haloterrigena turkmenica]ADB61087.1 pyrroline-5-carboxylate reductase [Haloterrigena turkmenica DSM 5511]